VIRTLAVNTSNSSYQLISAIGTLVIGVLGSLGGLAAFIAVFRRVGTVHEIVNSQRTEMTKYIQTVQSLLVAHGIEVPKRKDP
jgi:phage-related minor tail protein